jgi:phage tail sheath protein FI
VTADPKTGARKLIPPGGHVLGVYARSDVERGVFKAPANEIVRGGLALEYDINDRVQDTLNPRGVNVVRSFPGRGIRVWGARTMTSDALWKYVSVRRLFIFHERSISEGTQWVVFEPNDDRLWARVIDTIRLFLRGQWRGGALLGRTEQEAFFITCDRTTMSQDDILNGRLICEIGIAPVRPAEFVIFRIFQNTAEAQR